MLRPRILLAMFAIVACRADGGGPQAERPGVVNTGEAYRGPVDDAGILTLVADINNSEITGSKAALVKLRDPSAMSLAQQLAGEHIMMNAALDSLSVKRDTAAGAPPQFVTMQVANKVRSTLINTMPAGPAYDRAWAAMQVSAHGEALDSLRVWQAVAKDASVRDALGAAMQRVRLHLERAQMLQTALGAGASPGDTMPRAAVPQEVTTPTRPAVAKPAPGMARTPTVQTASPTPKKTRTPPKDTTKKG